MKRLCTLALLLLALCPGLRGQNLATQATATASTVEGGFVAANAADGDPATRWASAYETPSWIMLDLGQSYSLSQVVLTWERACAESYQILVSDVNSTPDPSSPDWTVLSTQTGRADAARTDTLTGLSGAGRYVAMYATNKLHPWGYSLFEFEVYGSTGSACGSANTALNQTAAASSAEGAYAAALAFDGDPNTRWASSYADDEWLRVDLGGTYSVCEVVLSWEAAYGSSYALRLGTSTDLNASTVIATVTGGDGGTDVVPTDAGPTGRYLWMRGLARGTGFGYSLWEMAVHTSAGSLPNQAPTAQAGPDQSLAAGTTTTTLLGTGTDPDQDPITYQWTQLSGPALTLSGASTANATLAGLADGNTYTFRLTVSDGALSATDDVTVSVSAPTGGGCGTTNVALNQAATASTFQEPFGAAEAFDGDLGTRWGSGFSDDEWLRVDLGSTQNVCQVTLHWEGAYGADYEIRLGGSTDINAATVIATVTGGDGGVDVVPTDAGPSGRYLWMRGLARGTGWGYSLWEMEVNTGSGSIGDTEPPTNPTGLSASAAVYAVTLSWSLATDNVGVTAYRIYEGATLKATTDGASNSMTISGLNPETAYTYTVKAVDAAGNESSGAPVSFTTQADGGSEGTIGIGNVALGLPATSSSTNTPGVNPASNATDGNVGSRWESAFTDSEWITVDLGLKYQIGRVILHWEAASGRDYLIQVSDDNVNWTTVYTFDGGEFPIESRTDDLLVSGSGQYIRMQGIERNTPWSYSLFEFEVYSPGSGPEDIPDPNPNPNPAPVPPGPSTFAVVGPTNGAMITNTRMPTLSWQASPGATSYEVWVNVTKTDYDWYAWGNLLDRFTLMGEVTGTSFTLPQPLTDRWTYKWYVVAKGASTTYSDLGQFSVYLPTVEQQNDGVSLINGMRDMNKNGTIEPYEDWHQPIQTRINDLMARMTIEEKAYQMFYNAQAFPQSGWAFGPGTVSDMFNKQMASANTRLGIPFVSAGDCIHGYATTYPTQSALAASRNLELVRQCGDMQRVEQKAVGFRGTLAPLAEVGTKVLYPRIQEGCGEDADFAAAMVRAMVTGLQAGPELNPNSVLVTTKHWPGEGAGGEALIVYDGVTIKYHMKPWFANVDANAGSIMPGYAGSSFLDPGGPGAGDSKPILDYLREVVGFDGVVTTDWLPWGAWVDAANAGSDVMGGADPGAEGFSMATFINEVGEARINEAVQRILNVKFRLGVFEDPYGDPVNGPDAWYTPEHEALVIQAARESMTLLKNDGTMPLNLPAGSNLLVTGSRATDGSAHSIWTSYFHEDDGALTMYEAIQAKGQSRGLNVYLDNAPSPDAAIVVIGEPTYTHGTMWDNEKPYIHDAYYPISDRSEYDLTTLNQVKALGIPYIVVLFMPRPFVLTDVVDDANALLVVYRPGDGGGPAAADVLFGDYAPTGRLPWQLPRSMDQIGLDNLSEAKERWDLPFDLGATAAEIQEIRSKIAAGEPLQPIYGDPLFQYGFGLQGYTLSKAAQGATTQPEFGVPTAASWLQLYPNPTGGTLHLRLRAFRPGDYVEVLDQLGRVRQQEPLYGPTLSLSTMALPAGLYYVRINGAPNFTQAFIKQ